MKEKCSFYEWLEKNDKRVVVTTLKFVSKVAHIKLYKEGVELYTKEPVAEGKTKDVRLTFVPYTAIIGIEVRE